MNTLLKLFKYSAGMALGLLLLMSPAAHAAISPATVLAINTDTANKKLYVEVSYIGRPCLIYQLKFGLEILRDGAPFGGVDPNIARPFKVVTGAGDSVVWRIDGNDETNANKPSKGYITKIEGDDSGTNDTLMYDMQISGYRLEFDLATISGLDRLRPSDSINVCLRSQMKPIKCAGCGTAGSDRMFSLNDIAAGCPYDYENKEDLIACYRRDSKVQNWEGWIADARDCQRYRIVQMPDGKWWMAQNLNFQGTEGNKLTFKSDYALLGASGVLDSYNGVFWCPDSAVKIIVDSLPPASLKDSALYSRRGSRAACDTYGALYPAITMFIKDGKSSGSLTTSSSDLTVPVLRGDTTTAIRGICPEGWMIPSNDHWGKMLNLVEKNCEDTSKHYGCTTTGDNSTATTGFPILGGDSAFRYNPCKHVQPVNQRQWNASACAYKDLLSTNVAPYREMDTVPNYMMNGGVNSWGTYTDRRSFRAPKRITRYATENNPVWSYFYPETAGTDKYGFSVLPAGMKYYDDATHYGLGEAAHFWTSTAGTRAIVTSGNYVFRSFIYNEQLNPIIAHAIYAPGTVYPYFGFSVRCMADKK